MNATNKQSGHADDGPAKPAQAVQVDIRLRAVEYSDQPVLSNFTVVQGAPGMVFVDFGFLEPQAFNAIARAGRSGAKMPETVGGQLASRVAMNLQTASQLAQQLNDLLRRARRQAAVEAPEAADAAGANPQ
jgi:hypothetical protein